jgi:hypothetical protein
LAGLRPGNGRRGAHHGSIMLQPRQLPSRAVQCELSCFQYLGKKSTSSTTLRTIELLNPLEYFI